MIRFSTSFPWWARGIRDSAGGIAEALITTSQDSVWAVAAAECGPSDPEQRGESLNLQMEEGILFQ